MKKSELRQIIKEEISMVLNAKEFWISKYPDAEKDWGKTGHDDRFQVRMMEEYAEYRVKKCDLADVVECAGNKRTPHEKRSEK